MEFIKDLISFLKSSTTEKVEVNKTVFKKALLQFIILDIILGLTVGILLGLCFSIFDSFKEVIASRYNFEQMSLFKQILHICILSPIVEELSFRLGLKVNKLNISIYLGFNIIAIILTLSLIELTLPIRYLLILGIALLSYFTIQNNHLSFFKKHHVFFLRYNIIFFAIIHAGNYQFTTYYQYIYIPFLILMPFVIGIYFSYARLKYGFFIAVFMHCFHNTISTIFNNIF